MSFSRFCAAHTSDEFPASFFCGCVVPPVPPQKGAEGLNVGTRWAVWTGRLQEQRRSGARSTERTLKDRLRRLEELRSQQVESWMTKRIMNKE